MEESPVERRDGPVYLGVDTRSSTHVGVAPNGTGRRLGVLAVPNTEASYAELVGWVLGFGAPIAAGVEARAATGPGSPAS